MSVLLTGASGFIGKVLLRKLLSTSQHIKACYRILPPTFPEGVSCFEIPSLAVAFEAAWRNSLDGVKVVVHTAARVHVMNDEAVEPLQEFRSVNVDGTLALARWAVDAGVQRFVFISSIKAMGEQTILGAPFSADSPCDPIDPYGISKREAEQGLMRLAQETGLEVVIIRPPLVYGPGVKANFASMMRWLHYGVPLPLGGVSANRRSFVALDNLVDLIAVCTSHPRAANQVFLISDGEDLSTSDLLRRMGDALGSAASLPALPVCILKWGARLIHQPEIFDRLCGSLQVDIDKTRELLGWSPPLTVNEGLKRAAAEFNE